MGLREERDDEIGVWMEKEKGLSGVKRDRHRGG